MNTDDTVTVEDDKHEDAINQPAESPEISISPAPATDTVESVELMGMKAGTGADTDTILNSNVLK